MGWEDEERRLRETTGLKWGWFADDVIPAWIADMDLEPAPAIIDAMRALVDRGDLGYNIDAERRLPEVFAERQHARFGWRPDTERLHLFTNVMQPIEVAMWLHTNPGDGVVLFTPVYPPFFRAIEQCGCRLVDVPLSRPGWRLDTELLESSVDSATRVIVVCNPHNPTGRVFSREELSAIAEIAERHNLLVISDEVWADVAFTGAEHVPFATLSPDAAQRTVTVNAASKAFNVAGMRCSVAHFGHAGVADALAKLPEHVLGSVNSLGAEATLAAWTLGDEWLAETVAHLERNRDRLATRLARELPDVRFTVPQATYLAWLDFSAAGIGDEPAAELLERAKVALLRGLDFGQHGAGFARLNFACSEAMLDEMVDRMVAALGARET